MIYVVGLYGWPVCSSFSFAMSSAVWIVAPRGELMRNILRFAPWGDFDSVLRERVDLCPPVVDGNLQWPGWLRELAEEAQVELPQRRGKTSTQTEYKVIGLARLSGRGALL